MNYVLTFKIIGWGVFLFNIFTIYILWKSNIFNKWLKMLLPLLLNFPSFIYSEFQGLHFKFLMFQVLGRGDFVNYQPNPFEEILLGESALFSIPIGSLYVFYKLENWERLKEQADEGI